MKTLRNIVGRLSAAASLPAGPSRRGGQAIIFVMMVLVILVFVALWQFDLHKTLFVKYRSRNGGDAAALAAARWQAISLNLVGELNIMQAVYISQGLAGDTNAFVEAKQVADLEARVPFTGPMVGFLAAEEAAKNNGMFNNAQFTQDVSDHAGEIRREYLTRYPDPPYHNDPEPPTAWDDYADMCDEIASLGVAAAPDNARYYTDFADWNHMLLNPSFYDAIASQDWCWFFFNAYDLLKSYQSFRDWPALPIYVEPRPADSEFFGLDLRRFSQLSLMSAIPRDNGRPITVKDLLIKLKELADPQYIDTNVVNVAANWLFYRDEVWSSWTDYIGKDFPFRGAVKPEYDYAGADSAVRLVNNVERHTPGIQGADVTWSAAAKPFGTLEGAIKPCQYGLVLPAFTDVRMIPIDASSAPAAGSRPGWGIHIHDHLPNYVQNGLGGLDPNCWYCAQLRTWEDPTFRATGIQWLLQHSDECVIRGPGPGGGGGGTHRGH